ncbi:MAG: TadE/TadG family type IV pilus assembly protein [Actinomycetota bacterium]
MNEDQQRRESGSASLDLVLVFPAVLFALAALVQGALWAHGDHVVDAAAREGARAARLSGNPTAGKAGAEAFLHRYGRDVILSPDVAADVKAGVARVTVQGRAVPLLPGLALPLRATSSGEVERFVPAVAQ